MITSVVKRVKFCAAHYLPGYKGKCANLHGHTFYIDISLKGPIDKTTGMIVDFTEFEGAMKPILDNWDHHCLNNVGVVNPTAENLAYYVFNWLRDNWIQTVE